MFYSNSRYIQFAYIQQYQTIRRSRHTHTKIYIYMYICNIFTLPAAAAPSEQKTWTSRLIIARTSAIAYRNWRHTLDDTKGGDVSRQNGENLIYWIARLLNNLYTFKRQIVIWAALQIYRSGNVSRLKVNIDESHYFRTTVTQN